MKYIFLKSFRKLEPLLDFDINSNNIDLHNDFEFVKAKINSKNLEFSFTKVTNDTSYNEKNLTVVFYNVLECSHGTQTELDKLVGGLILINFAKGDLMKPHKYSGDGTVDYFFMKGCLFRCRWEFCCLQLWQIWSTPGGT